MTDLTPEETRSMKKSYLNLVGLFLSRDKIESRYLRCLLKWGFQLHLSPDDLRQANVDFSRLAFSHPSDKVEKVEALYHLVHMICLDQVVEDVELEVAGIYAEELGFSGSLVSDLLKSIVTADSDGTPLPGMRERVVEFLKLNEGADGGNKDIGL
jgi:hypothetical protein